jgi:hypothetical protein
VSNNQLIGQSTVELRSSGRAGKKAYHTPRLENYGEVRELTLTTPGVPYGSDNGTYPYSYASGPG